MLAAAAVHTTGVNWESIGIILGTVVAAFAFIDRLQARRSDTIRSEITSAVEHLGEVLTERLETKETVAKLTERIAKVEARKRR